MKLQTGCLTQLTSLNLRGQRTRKSLRLWEYRGTVHQMRPGQTLKKLIFFLEVHGLLSADPERGGKHVNYPFIKWEKITWSQRTNCWCISTHYRQRVILPYSHVHESAECCNLRTVKDGWQHYVAGQLCMLTQGKLKQYPRNPGCSAQSRN